MDLGLDSSFGSVERLGDLEIGQAVDMAEDDYLTLGARQRLEQRSPGGPNIAAGERVCGRFRAGFECHFDRMNTFHTRPVAAHVQHDRGEPGPEANLADPTGLIRRQCSISPDQRVLGSFLGVAAVAKDAKGNGEQSVLVALDKRDKGAVEVPRQIGGQGFVGGRGLFVHHLMKHPSGHRGCILAFAPLLRHREWPGSRSSGESACDNPRTMPPDDRFDDLAQSLGGFYQSWVIYLGLELGLFEWIRQSGPTGILPAELAKASTCQPEPVETWARAAHASELLDLHGDRIRLRDDVAVVLLDESRPEYLGGQFVAAVVSSLDYGGLVEFFRTGRTIAERPPRFHRAIEAVTVQDIVVFFQEGLAALPDLAASLARGGRVLDVACGGGKWLIALAARFPNTQLVGVEFEPDSVARAMRHVTEAGLGDRVRIEAREIPAMPYDAEFDLVYIQDALHELPDPVASLRAAWRAVRPGGRLVVLEWCLPADPEESRTLQAELLWGIQIDELFQGTRMYTHDGFLGLFAEAGVPRPAVIDLLSGATLFVVSHDG